MSSFPAEVRNLVEHFARNRDALRSPAYNEAQARQEFIDPFFKALGWDMDNEHGLAEAYKDVIHEDAIKIGGATKAPDYCFRIGGTRKFFVEAKKPAVGLDTEPEPAYQLRRYAWTSKLPLSILTDFEEFAVYDCRIRPAPTDKATTARVFYCTCDEYADKWDWIAGLFTKDAVLKGAFDKYAESSKRKKGTAEVDAEFLRQIEAWRETLAQNFALRNARLSVRNLNSAVQRTIDRLVFLRMCEDRGVETYGQLQALVNGQAMYARLGELFQRADERYNSGLFYFTAEKGREAPDTFTLGLKLDDKVLKDIINSLYYPESPYEFSVLPAEILGQVYEQFLGKVIRLTAGHHAKVEEKPEVRKAGGVYYTPTYIVDYIVKNTVGKLLEGKTPADAGPDVASPPRGRRSSRPSMRGRSPSAKSAARPLRILDPACGSGSFLLGAYQFLLDGHRDWYVNDGPENHRDRIYQGAGGQWRLAIQEKKRILLNNVYGVDIDPQAVETTKLSLLLKVLEGETAETIGSTLRLFHERALPDLDKNIKCGNSLIGPDFYDRQQMSLFDDNERLRINAFDWEKEFPAVFPNPETRNPDPDRGFDGVIGNPPYVFARDEGFTIAEKEYFSRFRHQNYQLNTFTLFVEQSFVLTRQGGCLGVIIPNNWLSISTMAPFRDFVLGSGKDIIVVNHLFKVFSGANVDTSVLVLVKGPPTSVTLAEAAEPYAVTLVATAPSAEIRERRVIPYGLYRNRPAAALLDRLDAISIALGDVATVKAGLKAYETGKGTPPQTDRMKHDRVYHSMTRLDSTYRPYLDGRDVCRYSLAWSGQYLKYGSNLAAPRDEALFCGERILVRQIPARPPHSIHAASTSGNEVHDINSMVVKCHAYPTLYVLGLINSRLLTFWFALRLEKFQRAIFPQFKVNELSLFPIARLDAERETSRPRLVALVQQMLDLPKSLAAAQTAHEKTVIQRQIDTTDRQIDQLVYELYGLTDAEIALVEGASK